MPTIRHEFGERLSSVDEVRGDNRRRRMARGARGGGPLGIFMIKTLPMIMVRVGADVNGSLREAGRSDACPKDAEGGDTHDRGTAESETAAAFPDEPDKRHVYTPLLQDNSTAVSVDW